MLRRPRDTEPQTIASNLARILDPVDTITWGPLALSYLGVPIVVGIHMLVVRDEDYQIASAKLINSGFIHAPPNRTPPPEVLGRLRDPQGAVDRINAGYRLLDHASARFNYPVSSSQKEQVFLLPNSFAHLPTDDIIGNFRSIPPGSIGRNYDIYGNLLYPLEHSLIESLVAAAIDDDDSTGISHWGELLRSWISMIVGYLDANNDILDRCPDKRRVEWFSVNFGRKREAEVGPLDRRITKRLGSKREMPVDMRGDQIQE